MTQFFICTVKRSHGVILHLVCSVILDAAGYSAEMPLFRKFQIEIMNFRKIETVSLDKNNWSKRVNVHMRT